MLLRFLIPLTERRVAKGMKRIKQKARRRIQVVGYIFKMSVIVMNDLEEQR